ncbi:pentatricopeptide repeat-containing protein At2g20710, mitochondrial-like isoform X4 [Salvia hispanica]|uniref:pentatricopeptide repeat-containing protein At2g20710, mitochondrial-like isoform X3 n=1 Tax=Salvia hispanica TaxID=49212 RepID=UPI0020094078|nr:pentatricopeptide repeat-containing protein At2g20710, mitochondrial-like isoform X3 [Salvia hispanica]XP_047980057.1 pentatricopeptide repeat-containing protein At2g20710, mitochondrial-like isoform X4 [Salvia hispanica]
MMKFLQKFSDSIMKRAVWSPSGWRISMYSTERSPNLYDRLVKCYRDRASVIPVLDEWVAQVGDIRQQTLQLFITNFTKRRRFTPALHIVEWMSRSRNQEHVKLEALAREMQDEGIVYNRLTYEILLKGYARFDLERMERLLVKMEADYWDYINFHTYATAAKGYLKAGDSEKAYALLRKAESLTGVHGGSSTYLSLITYYAAMQRTEDVYRVWNLLPDFAELSNKYYVTMISSLEKLEDLDGARNILEEWEGTNADFDIEIPNLVIRAYCKKGGVRDAEIILKRLMDAGKELNALTFSHMALGYLKDGQMEKTVEFTKKAFLASLPSWKPNLIVVSACLEYLQEKKDANGMQEMLMLLEKYGSSKDGVKDIIQRFSSNEKPKTENRNKTAATGDFYIPLFSSIYGGKTS